MKEYNSKLKDMPIIKLFFEKGNFSRVGPMSWVFFGAVILLLIGLIVQVLKVFVLVGGFVFFVYIVVFVVGIWNGVRKK